MQRKRTEQKIITTVHDAVLLKRKLQLMMQTDEHCKSSLGYTVRTLYFDTADNKLRENNSNEALHEEIRIRVYPDGDEKIKLQYKRTDNDVFKKESLIIDENIFYELIKGNYEVLLNIDDQKAQSFYWKLNRGLKPKKIVDFKRFSYIQALNNIKISVDTDIRETRSSFDILDRSIITYPAAPCDMAVIDIKYDDFLFDYIKDTLRILKKFPCNYSVYRSAQTFKNI